MITRKTKFDQVTRPGEGQYYIPSLVAGGDLTKKDVFEDTAWILLLQTELIESINANRPANSSCHLKMKSGGLDLQEINSRFSIVSAEGN